MVRIQTWNFVPVAKAQPWAHIQNFTCNSKKECDFLNTQILKEYLGELMKP